MAFNLSRWMIRYKAPHIITWAAISLFIISVNYDRTAPLAPQVISDLLFTALTIPVAYLEYYLLVPQYLFRKKFFQFALYSIGAIFATSILDYVISMSVYHLLTNHPIFPSAGYVFGLINTAVLISLIAAAIGSVLKIAVNRSQMERQLRETEKEKISTELNFLRSQVNPHFLFNVLNTIYFQIDKSNSQARGSLEKLSEMLRYQLYDCTTDKINIEAEVEYLRNYIAIQSLRMEKGTDIRFCLEDSLSGFFIAPLLLLPPIENAFKHVSSFRDPAENKISITLDNDDESLTLRVANTYDTVKVTKHLLNAGGLGIQNLKRRLGLLYPGRHLFSTSQNESVFETTLKIQYNDQLPYRG
jgi:two-component system, LytTR family, sensor kinase